MPREYIERQKLLTHLYKRLNYLREENGSYDHYTDGYEEAVDKVEDFPTVDVVEVVRCKDCKHLTVRNSPTLYAYCEKTKYRFEPFQTDTRTHSCSYGERKKK